ncbi:uncharacterized protein LOC121795100 [Salvia splendens]|uniref:uncharacterized protein LOC121795100 n=1 Tax=Salvia splendens TaxID=180675 RepID=UPI001103F81E|nr:uncharacterized protein LOC121795100 [Salvia splendens]
MAFTYSLRSSTFFNPKTAFLEGSLNLKFNSHFASKISVKNGSSQPFLSKWIPPGAVSPVASPCGSSFEDDLSVLESQCRQVEFNRVEYLVRVLHESARSFSLAMQSLEVAGTGPPLAMAWNGVDVHAWHKHVAYQAAAYALLKAAMEVELFLSHNRSNNSPVNEILSLSIDLLQGRIESQLDARDPKLVKWFRVVELPRIAGCFMPLFKKWSAEYAGSGIAGTIMAITCCATVGKLGSGRISCSSLSNSINQTLIELMTMASDLVSLEKLHSLATEAGFEEDFLSHFGSRVLPSKNSEDIEFWIGLVHRKLSAALERESVIEGRHGLSNKVEEKTLATLALFSYLGRESRLFLSRHNIEDTDEQVKDFISYLECGVLAIYPEFSTLSVYQLLMEVIIDEIRWLDLFAAYDSQFFQEGRRSKSHPIQAEKEMILYTVFTICYDVISGFAHYTSSTQQNLDSRLLEFLLQSQGLLTACLEDYWAAYDGTSDLLKIGERNGSDSAPSLLFKSTKNPSLIMDALQTDRERHKQASPPKQVPGDQTETSVDCGMTKPNKQNFLRKSVMKLVTASVDVWMGTQLLFVDVSEALRFAVKKLCGRKATKRERRKMNQTLSDLATLIPVTILMLLPVSAVGHAAMFAAIKRYVPCLIPSPYSDERLDLVKQLKRTKRKVQRVKVDETSTKA